VLEQEAQVAANVLAKQQPPVRRAADVHAVRRGREDRLPPGPGEAVAPVGLLAEEEEALIEPADLVDRTASNEQARPHHPVDVAFLVVREAAAVEGVQRLRMRRELAQEEVFGRHPPCRREATDGALQRPVRVA
jgi:hypothetical protein